jgi:hypothetical protein
MLVYVGIPVFDGKPYAAMVDSLLAEQLKGFGEGVHFLVDWEPGCALIGHARNKLARRFLNTKEADCIVFVDADISWSTGQLTSLAKRPEDVIGGTYRLKQDDVTFHVRGPVEAEGALYRVGGVPGGFMKVSRRAFDKTNAQQYQCGPHVLAEYFPTGIMDGSFFGEDYGFCHIWGKSGGTIWLDPSIRLRHHDGMRHYEGDPAQWLRSVHAAK